MVPLDTKTDIFLSRPRTSRRQQVTFSKTWESMELYVSTNRYLRLKKLVKLYSTLQNSYTSDIAFPSILDQVLTNNNLQHCFQSTAHVDLMCAINKVKPEACHVLRCFCCLQSETFWGHNEVNAEAQELLLYVCNISKITCTGCTVLVLTCMRSLCISSYRQTFPTKRNLKPEIFSLYDNWLCATDCTQWHQEDIGNFAKAEKILKKCWFRLSCTWLSRGRSSIYEASMNNIQM